MLVSNVMGYFVATNITNEGTTTLIEQKSKNKQHMSKSCVDVWTFCNHLPACYLVAAVRFHERLSTQGSRALPYDSICHRLFHLISPTSFCLCFNLITPNSGVSFFTTFAAWFEVALWTREGSRRLFDNSNVVTFGTFRSISHIRTLDDSLVLQFFILFHDLTEAEAW